MNRYQSLRALLLTFSLVLLSLACDSVEDESSSFQAVITGDVTEEMVGTATISYYDLPRPDGTQLFLELVAFSQGFIILSRPSSEPLSEGTYNVGFGESGPEAFSGSVNFGSSGTSPDIFLVRSGTLTVEEASEVAAQGTFTLVAESLGGDREIRAEGTFRTRA